MKTFLIATENMGYMSIRGRDNLDALRTMRLMFGRNVKPLTIMEVPDAS